MERFPRPGCQVRPMQTNLTSPFALAASELTLILLDSSAALRRAQFCALCSVLLACTTMFGSTSLDLTHVQNIAVLSDCLSFIECDYLQYGTMDVHVADTYRTRLIQCFKLQYKQRNVSCCQALRPSLFPVMCTCSAYVLSFAAASATFCVTS